MVRARRKWKDKKYGREKGERGKENRKRNRIKRRCRLVSRVVRMERVALPKLWSLILPT